MTTNNHKNIENIQKNWQQAFDICQQNMPSTSDFLPSELPIFAVIITASNVQDNNKSDHAITKLTDWAEAQQYWDLHVIECNSQSNNAIGNLQPTIQNDRLTPVDTHRFMIYPNSAQMLESLKSKDKRTAAAHVIDEQITALFEEHNSITATIDCHILPAYKLTQPHKLAFFDMDSTLIEQEVIVELAKETGIGEKVNEITESAMRGEIGFDESFTQRVALLKDTPTDVLDNISNNLTLSAGAKTTLATLKAMGYYTVLVSGGFTYFAQNIAKQLGMDEFHANELDTSDGKVTGKVALPIVNGEKKAEIVQKIAKEKNIDLSEVICIGDGANDLAMMAVADLGFAYRAKPIVQARADLAINCTGLEGVLYALGVDAITEVA